MLIERVADRFGLGRVVEPAVPVPGGLSNASWRLRTDRGTYAIKRMVVDADRPGFADNVEGAFAVESRAYAAGVAMPAPVPDPQTGRALARVGGGWVRVHRWVDGTAGDGSAVEAALLLAQIQAAGDRRWSDRGDRPWLGQPWGDDVAGLARTTARDVPSRTLVVDSHRDLDRKNALRRSDDGALLAVDWDAAGVTSAVQEAVGMALDWAGPEPAGFGAAMAAYRAASDVAVPAEPWVFAGWVAAQGGWLDYNLAERRETALGRDEVTATLGRLRRLAATLDLLLDALGR